MARFVMPSLSGLYGVESNPGFELTFISAGQSFKAFVRARNSQAAAEEAICEMSAQCPEFQATSARLVAVVQVR